MTKILMSNAFLHCFSCILNMLFYLCRLLNTDLPISHNLYSVILGMTSASNTVSAVRVKVMGAIQQVTKVYITG